MLKPLPVALLALVLLAAGPAIAAPEAVKDELEPVGDLSEPSAAPPADGPIMKPAPGLPVLPAVTVYGSAVEARVEIPLPEGTPIEERATATEWRLIVPGWAPPSPSQGGAMIGPTPFTDPVLGALSVKATPNGVALTLPWKHWCPTAIEWRQDPPRLAVTLRKVFKVTVSEDLAPGVRHDHVRSADAAGPLSLHVLRVDTKAPGVKVQPAIAKNTFFARESVSALVRQNGAIAGINGAYFSSKTGEPLGLLMIDGELVAGPMFNRTALAWGGGEAEIGRTQLATRLVLPSGESYDFDGVNQPRGLNRMVLYTARYGNSTFTDGAAKNAKEYTLLPDGTVLGESGGNAPIGPGGMVVSAQGQAAEWLAKRVRVGDKLAVKSALSDLWPGVRHVLGGGPTLLDDGEVRVTAAEEQFRPDISQGRAPRTAVGLATDGQMLLVTVDGRQPRSSIGVTLDGLARVMRDLGANDALNLDGGGSTAMTVHASTVNRPSDGSERAVNNALLVFSLNQAVR